MLQTIFLRKPVSKGLGLIIFNSENENVFIPNAHLKFKSQSKADDYHDHMNFQDYKNGWSKHCY